MPLFWSCTASSSDAVAGQGLEGTLWDCLCSSGKSAFGTIFKLAIELSLLENNRLVTKLPVLMDCQLILPGNKLATWVK